MEQPILQNMLNFTENVHLRNFSYDSCSFAYCALMRHQMAETCAKRQVSRLETTAICFIDTIYTRTIIQ